MSYHTLKYGTKFLKGTHGLWFTLGAIGIGFVVGKKLQPKHKRMKVLPILGARTRKCLKDLKKGWYGIVDEAKENLDKGQDKGQVKPRSNEVKVDYNSYAVQDEPRGYESNVDSRSNEVKVNRRVISGYQTETISRT